MNNKEDQTLSKKETFRIWTNLIYKQNMITKDKRDKMIKQISKIYN